MTEPSSGDKPSKHLLSGLLAKVAAAIELNTGFTKLDPDTMKFSIMVLSLAACVTALPASQPNRLGALSSNSILQ